MCSMETAYFQTCRVPNHIHSIQSSYHGLQVLNCPMCTSWMLFPTSLFPAMPSLYIDLSVAYRTCQEYLSTGVTFDCPLVHCPVFQLLCNAPCLCDKPSLGFFLP